MYKFSNTQKGFLLIALLCNTHVILHGMKEDSFENNTFEITDNDSSFKSPAKEIPLDLSLSKINFDDSNDSLINISSISNNNNNTISPRTQFTNRIFKMSDKKALKKVLLMNREELCWILSKITTDDSSNPKSTLDLPVNSLGNLPFIFNQFKHNYVRETSDECLRILVQRLLGLSVKDELKQGFKGFTLPQHHTSIPNNQIVIDPRNNQEEQIDTIVIDPRNNQEEQIDTIVIDPRNNQEESKIFTLEWERYKIKQIYEKNKKKPNYTIDHARKSFERNYVYR